MTLFGTGSYAYKYADWVAATYQLGNTSFRTITEVKQCRARLVLGWATDQVLPECCC